MNRLYYFWTEGDGGGTGQAPSGPIKQPPVLAASPEEAAAKLRAKLTSWDGPIMGWSFDEHARPRVRYDLGELHGL